MDPELLYAKFYQALTEQRYADAKNAIYQAHREGMPAGHILVKLVNRALDQLNKNISKEGDVSKKLDFGSISKQYFESIVSANRGNAQKLIANLVASHISPSDIFLKVITPALDSVGELQSRQAISMAQIFMASKIVEDALSRLTPMMTDSSLGTNGKVIIGNAFGDHHALGRKIVATFLRSYGFEVIDLGLSVPNEKFLDQAISENASLIFVSAFLLHTAQQIMGLRSLLIERNLLHIKIVGGGAPFNFDSQLYKRLGCDATASNALAAVQVAKDLLCHS